MFIKPARDLSISVAAQRSRVAEPQDYTPV
jgi:hypothetical protein